MADNPFRPGFGQYPTVPALRTELLRRWSDAFHPDTTSHPATKTVLIGDRGIGKTVLLDIAIDIAREAGWLVADAAGVDIPSLSQRLVDRLWRPEPRRRHSTKVGLRIGPGSVEREWSPPDPSASPASLRDAVEVALSGESGITPTGVLLVVDELHDVPATQIKQVANELQLLERDGYRVGFVGAGLPLLDLGDEARVPTFLARSWRPNLGTVADDEVARVFVETLQTVGGDCAPAALGRVVAAVGGLPYAMQLLGWHLLDRHGPEIRPDHVDDVLPDVHAGLRSALRLDYDVSPGRGAFLAAMADHDGPVELATIVERLDRNAQQLSTTRKWLLDHGYLTAPARGELEFARVGLRALVSTDPDYAAIVAGWYTGPTWHQA